MNFGGHIRDLGPVGSELLDAVRRKLAAEVSQRPDFWDVYDDQKPNKYPVFKKTTQHVVFSFPVTFKSAAESRFYPVWNEGWREVIEPLMAAVTPYYGYSDGRSNRIMLAKLLAGAVIPKHVDEDESSAVPHKIHVPLFTYPEVEFWEADQTYHLDEGRAYEVNNRILHGGQNRSAHDRVHLIFDYFSSRALAERAATQG